MNGNLCTRMFNATPSLFVGVHSQLGNVLMPMTLIQSCKLLNNSISKQIFEWKNLFSQKYCFWVACTNDSPSQIWYPCPRWISYCVSFPRFHAERAIDIITHILPEDHLLLASSKRVKGKSSCSETFGCSWLRLEDNGVHEACSLLQNEERIVDFGSGPNGN